MASTESPELAKVERLAIAGEVAPVLRRRAGAPRKVTLVGKDGKPTGTTTDIEVAKSLLSRSEIEFSVQPGKRPAFVNCKTCGRPVKVRSTGTLPTTCRPNTHKCQCGRPINVGARCGFGNRCKRCLGAERITAHSSGGEHNRKVSDDELRAALANARGWRDAAVALGICHSAVDRRARRLGIRPGLRQ
jgi:hypothetical protein